MKGFAGRRRWTDQATNGEGTSSIATRIVSIIHYSLVTRKQPSGSCVAPFSTELTPTARRDFEFVTAVRGPFYSVHFTIYLECTLSVDCEGEVEVRFELSGCRAASGKKTPLFITTNGWSSSKRETCWMAALLSTNSLRRTPAVCWMASGNSSDWIESSQSHARADRGRRLAFDRPAKHSAKMAVPRFDSDRTRGILGCFCVGSRDARLR